MLPHKQQDQSHLTPQHRLQLLCELLSIHALLCHLTNSNKSPESLHTYVYVCFGATADARNLYPYTHLPRSYAGVNEVRSTVIGR